MQCVIVCNGLEPGRSLLSNALAEASLFIGADGGGNVALKLGFTPDVVIGDLDSFTDHESPDIQVIKDTDQETNDLEKALAYAIDQEMKEVIILGATGKRLDHTLKNLSVLQQFHHHFESILIRDDYLDVQVLPARYERAFPLGTQVSLFPLSGEVTHVRTDGLKYPLRDESLINGVRDGSSNEVVDSPVIISHDEGTLLFMINRGA